MCPSTCIRFSVPTRTRNSPSPPKSRAPNVVRPSKSPTLLNISPHWLASRLTTLTPSRSLQQGHLRAEEVDMGIGGDPAALTPRQRSLQLEGELIRLRRDPTVVRIERSRSRG